MTSNHSLDFVFDPARLGELALRHRQEYAAARPFPHLMLDDFLPAATLEAVLEEFPRPGAVPWRQYDNAAENKLEYQDESGLGVHTRRLLAAFNSSTFVDFLESLTAIRGLVPDPHFWGGGLHQIERGGFLKIHADFSRHPRLRLERRINVLVYLNKGWREEHGGQLELWNEEMSRCERRVLPIFGRCVIFNTTSTSFHGHPEPVSCPQTQTRKSIALYYYSVPGAAPVRPHSTLFQRRPGESYDLPLAAPARSSSALGRALRRLLPPIVIEARDAIRSRLRRPPGGRSRS